ncbi:transposase [Mangrovicoccus sp. HB161399]|uniref:transposase n=1 Tax=Mangrovicoccus sp. HB161399 TaxID=2720392 RepID=UPI001556C192|nr:transposase [Mangrovicoccus sp. HB161399]
MAKPVTEFRSVALRSADMWPDADFADTKIGSRSGDRRQKMKGRTFGKEVKILAVGLVQDRGVAVVQASRDLDVAGSVLGRWIRESSAAPAMGFAGHGLQRAALAEIGALEKGVATLKAERDIPRRAAAFFAREAA